MAVLPRVAHLSPPWAKMQRANARAILSDEGMVLAGARADVASITDSAIADIARQTDRSTDRGRGAILAILLFAGARIAPKLSRRIQSGRQSARATSIDRLRAELALASTLFALPPFQTVASLHVHTDIAHASAAADTYAAAWKSGAVHKVKLALDAGHSPERAVDQVTALVDARLQRIAATEVPQAYNDEHRRASAEVSTAIKDAGGNVAMLVRRWDAMLDACPRCRAHDGEVVPLATSFDSGDEPGYMHPRCRCLDTVIAIPRMTV